jgi:hypothetical protein
MSYGELSIKVTNKDVVVEVTGIPTERRSDHDGQNGRFSSNETISEAGIKNVIVEAITASLGGMSKRGELILRIQCLNERLKEFNARMWQSDNQMNAAPGQALSDELRQLTDELAKEPKE